MFCPGLERKLMDRGSFEYQNVFSIKITVENRARRPVRGY